MKFNFVVSVEDKKEMCDYCVKSACYKMKDTFYCEDHFKQTDEYSVFSKIKKLEIRDNLKMRQASN